MSSATTLLGSYAQPSHKRRRTQPPEDDDGYHVVPASVPSPSSPAAAHHFPVGQISRQLRQSRGDDVQRIGGGAPVYMTAVLEYLTTEILDKAAKEAKRRRRVEDGSELFSFDNEDAAEQGGSSSSSTITPLHLASVFAENEQWRSVMDDIAHSGELQHVQQQQTVRTAGTAPQHDDEDASVAGIFPALSRRNQQRQPRPTPAAASSPAPRTQPLPPTQPATTTVTAGAHSLTAVTAVLATEPGTWKAWRSAAACETTATQQTAFFDSAVVVNRRDSRPSLRRSRGWAGGATGNAVIKYEAQQRSQHGNRGAALCNPYA